MRLKDALDRIYADIDRVEDDLPAPEVPYDAVSAISRCSHENGDPKAIVRWAVARLRAAGLVGGED